MGNMLDITPTNSISTQLTLEMIANNPAVVDDLISNIRINPNFSIVQSLDLLLQTIGYEILDDFSLTYNVLNKYTSRLYEYDLHQKSKNIWNKSKFNIKEAKMSEISFSVLLYSIVLLYKNPTLNLVSFIKINNGIADGKNLPIEYLEEIYTETKNIILNKSIPFCDTY